MTNNSIMPLLEKTRNASRQIARLSDNERQQLVRSMADALEHQCDKILEANTKDCAKKDDSDPKKDRLMLNKERVLAIANDARNVAELSDPTNIVLSKTTLENNLQLSKITVPLGVVGIIYESRPNVTVDAAVLCLRSGNAIVLRGSSDALDSNIAIVDVLRTVLKQHNLDENIIQLLPVDRELVKELLEAEGYIDILIPRGSKGLIDFVRDNAKVPTIETGAGVCHTYVDKEANLTKAAAIVVNAKIQRPSVCNALDTILLQQDIAKDFVDLIVDEFKKAEVEIFADELSYQLLSDLNYPYLKKAKEDDFGREFLSLKCSIKILDNLDLALDHIHNFSSKHSEAIVTENTDQAEIFLKEVDATTVYHNASTRFTDGAVFGLGAEVGISTQKLHARGPFALEKLTCEKWIARGNGQIRK